MQDRPGSIALFVSSVALAMAIHWLHEAAHMLTAISFGVSGVMGTNTVSYATEMTETQVIWTTAAGPGLMVVFALLAAASRWRWAPTVLFVVFLQRAMAAGISAISLPNDEARLSLLLGLGTWSVFALTVGITAALFIWRWRKDGLGWVWLGISWFGVSIGIAAMVALNGVLPKIVF
ncbi:MAG: hypothetical protein HRT64_11880 [Erythrobacter sp.]|nr:hypothetical protein [Erythrobacter sp.]